ncbi:MAG TPA: amidohydrolase family protein [Candidatus Binatia bacterium]|jgi:adenine deaminase|nr:amidohydrolase family protein [Candidatus Binatia bacterium]
MEIFVEAGLSPMEALLAATKNPAERLGREKDFGLIASGGFADFVIVDANPLEDISATRKIHLVFKEGKEIKPKYHANYRNPIPQPFPDRAAPQIESISPLAVKQREGPVQINIKGQNFMSSAVVKINGTKVATEVKFSPINFPQNARRTNQIVATVDPKVVCKPGTYPVIVEHEGMGGAVSNAAYLVVNFR